MVGTRWAALAVMVAVLVAGCGGGDEGTTVERIAVVTPGQRADADLTGQSTAAVEEVARTLHVQVDVVDAGDGDVAGAVERAAANAQLVVVPFEEDAKAAVAAAAEADVPVLAFGAGASRAGAVGRVETADLPGAFGAGAISMKASYFRSAGIVVCGDADPAVQEHRYRMAGAFAAGAASVSPKGRLDYEATGDDPESTRLATAELLERRIQMVLALCGDATAGAMKAMNASIRKDDLFHDEVHLVAAVGDKNELNRNNLMLTSVMWDPTEVVEQAVRDLRTDRFGRRAYVLDVNGGGVSLLRTGRTPGDAYELGLVAARRAAEQPNLIPEVSSEAELRRFLRQR